MLTIRALSIFIFTSFLISCEGFFKLPEQSTGAKNIDELYVSHQFNWSTTKDVTVLINGLIKREGYPTQTAPLTISHNNQKFYTGFHTLHENYEIAVTIPVEIKSLKILYGQTEYTVDIKDNQAILTLTPVITEE